MTALKKGSDYNFHLLANEPHGACKSRYKWKTSLLRESATAFSYIKCCYVKSCVLCLLILICSDKSRMIFQVYCQTV